MEGIVPAGGKPGLPGAVRLSLIYEILFSNMWFLPMLLALAAVVSSSFSVYADARFFGHLESSAILVGGDADAIRDLLSTIATALISVVSIAFSITIIAVQQASNQYSPQVVRIFTADKGNQLVLGMYLGTFIFVLLVLRQVGGPYPGFVPFLSVGISIILTLLCLGLLIFFIHRMVTSLRVSKIIQKIHKDLIREIDLAYPDSGVRWGEEPRPSEEIMKSLENSGGKGLVRSEQTGFLSRMNKNRLAKIRNSGIRWIHIPITIGDFIPSGEVLAEIGNDGGSHPELNARIRKAFIIGDRTMESDPMYGIRQLLDIALRGLSPGVNAPTNAEFALYYLGDALNRLAGKKFSDCPVVFPGNPIKFVFRAPAWEEYIHFSFDQLRASFRNDVRITALVVDILGRIADRIVCRERAAALLMELGEIESSVEKGSFEKEEKALLLSCIEEARMRIAQGLEDRPS
jgi:uncharacterized membrane protein